MAAPNRSPVKFYSEKGKPDDCASASTFGFDQRAHLEHLAQEAAKIDELLIAGQISPELRLKLSTARQNLEQRIRGILAVQTHG
jgi:hypothetical protein